MSLLQLVVLVVVELWRVGAEVPYALGLAARDAWQWLFSRRNTR